MRGWCIGGGTGDIAGDSVPLFAAVGIRTLKGDPAPSCFFAMAPAFALAGGVAGVDVNSGVISGGGLTVAEDAEPAEEEGGNRFASSFGLSG